MLKLLGLETEACIVVSDGMLISILSVLVEALEMSCAEERAESAQGVCNLRVYCGV